MTFSSTVKFSTSMKCWWTMPMPAAIAAWLSGMRDRLAVDADLAAVGLVEAVEDRHQRRLAGAVLADDAVDGAAPDREVDVALAWTAPKLLLMPTSSIASGPAAPGRRARLQFRAAIAAQDTGQVLSVV